MYPVKNLGSAPPLREAVQSVGKMHHGIGGLAERESCATKSVSRLRFSNPNLTLARASFTGTSGLDLPYIHLWSD